MTRRTLLCNLDPQVERPELRTFRCNPGQMVLEDRGAYLADIFTIIRAYLVSSETVADQPTASYEQWSRMVREPLMWLCEADPVASMEQARSEDDGLNTIGELFALWRHRLGTDACARSSGSGRLASTMDYRAGSPGSEPMAFNKRPLVFGFLWLAIVAALLMIWLYGVAHHW